ncbi:hypothetical protein [Mycobacterium sp. 29Ha]|uniref:hypothetical protein n=1 Tax=Mycobacterium sp. 29Ha TaxID=2939268 RepID=UPI0029392AEB|nr:hypothetical protein [Mycobacterium sp. 29Ha]MDV3131448.1 hypothetical protein [Mycobacterium sp. 29Ha]
MTYPTPALSTLIVPPELADEYLLLLGIPTSVIRQAVSLGDLRAADIDTFHPRGAAGVTRWIGTVGGLRRGMVGGQDWKSKDALNRPTVERADGKVTLSVVGCDEATGDVDSLEGPRASYRRGPATIAAIRGQLELISVAALIPGEPVAPLSIDDAPPLGQWFLLYHRAEDGVRSEVSFAAGIDEQGEERKTGQFTGWNVRVILDPFQPDSTEPIKRPLDVGGDDVDFTIVRAS